MNLMTDLIKVGIAPGLWYYRTPTVGKSLYAEVRG